MVNGIINVYKEKGFTSFDVVAKMRGIYHQKKIGHTGTLDPDAEGVLPVCLGKATRVCDMLTDRDKEYEAVLLLGKATDTQDISGEVLGEADVTVSAEQVRAAIESFVGDYDQIPPMYSALKVQGQKLCDLARKGITVERKARRVHIYGIEILEIALPEIRMRVQCSKGTYIRTLCHDIGEKLGCHGCMKSLLRTKAAGFSLEQAHRLSELEQQPMEWILPVDTVFMHLPKVVAAEEVRKLLDNGNKIPVELVTLLTHEEAVAQKVRMYDEGGHFAGIYQYMEAEGVYKPEKMFI